MEYLTRAIEDEMIAENTEKLEENTNIFDIHDESAPIFGMHPCVSFNYPEELCEGASGSQPGWIQPFLASFDMVKHSVHSKNRCLKYNY
jgi:hypothetical protein